jgi:hypothetical protein
MAFELKVPVDNPAQVQQAVLAPLGALLNSSSRGGSSSRRRSAASAAPAGAELGA